MASKLSYALASLEKKEPVTKPNMHVFNGKSNYSYRTVCDNKKFNEVFGTTHTYEKRYHFPLVKHI